LSRSPDLESGDLACVARALTEAAERELGVARASIWLATAARDAICCADLYEAAPSEGATGRHSDGVTLLRAAYPAYFAAMEAERIVAAHEAQRDPRTAEFTEGYLRPLGITAMLDAPVWADGALAAVVCLEHVGASRTWTDDEQAFAGALADLLARALAATARRQAESALRRSEEQFRSMIENAADLITILAADGTITYQSPSALRVLGYRPDELVGVPLFGLVHPDDVAHVGEAFARVMAEPGAGVAVEFRIRHAGGSWRVLESRGTNLLGQPAVGGVVANSRDVTERRAADAAIARQRAELQRSNRELEHFAYVASHDLQEPLRKIQAFGDRLAEDCGPALGERGATYLDRMRDAARRMQELITDLLAFSRIATKPQPFRPVDLAAVAAGVLADLEVRVQQTAARVEVDAPVVVAADSLQCRQLLQNLVGNALKFHRAGVPPLVRVCAAVVAGPEGAGAPPGPWCRLTVEDNGIGFDEKYLDRIFNPFQRLHGRGAYEGTGMGLAICRKIAERHGGTITATSVVGGGTTFVVMLPLHQAIEVTPA
jgi:PAS domain S-box-containing protein